jgi:hypothetical protein
MHRPDGSTLTHCCMTAPTLAGHALDGPQGSVPSGHSRLTATTTTSDELAQQLTTSGTRVLPKLTVTW